MKRLCGLLLAFLFFFLPRPAFSDAGWSIESFESDIAIQRTGEVLITEKINADFRTLQKHGIYRDIPYIYDDNGVKTYTEIDIGQVLQNGEDAEFEISETNGYKRVKIGDPDRTISGKNKYEIVYTAKGVLRGFSDYDELYWNATGNNWEAVIERASATVTLPEEALLKFDCFEGYVGSTAECTILSESPSRVKFVSSAPLEPYQGLTIAAGYEKNLIPILTVERPKTFWEKFIEWPSLLTLFSTLFLGIGTIVHLWNKSGRDYWFGRGVFGKITDKGSVKPVGAYESTVVEYTPPENLRPAEIGVLFDEKADTLDVTSTIIDLATRGFLTIQEVDKKWLFGKTDYILKKTDKDSASNPASEKKLLGYEKMLLAELFQSGSEVKISSLKQTFYDELKKVKEELYNEVVAKNLFFQNPEKVRTKYYVIAFLMVFAGFFLMGFVISTGIVYLADILIGVVASGIALLIFAGKMPRRTAYGRDLYRRVKGYRLFIDKAETHRQKFFEKKNLFNEVLPYTIVFGLTEKFAKAMEEIGFKPSNPTWYSGTHHFNTQAFSSSVNSFSSSMSSAMASTPSSSGSGGGGSSGGGFGGGGGGSW